MQNRREIGARSASPRAGGPTVRAASRRWTAALAAAGIEDAGADVRRLIAAVLDVAPARLLSEPERALTEAELAALEGHMTRRAGHEPVSRILGRRDFYGRTFAISPATLDPRPDTETLVEAALGLVREEGWPPGGLHLLDVGTGSGCLLVTLLCELAGARGLGSDVSAPALAVARANAERLGVAGRASWLTADALESVPGPFHMLLSNPPYVRTSEIAHLQREVCHFDPQVSLDGGPDGLDLYRRMAPSIARVVPDGWTVLEVGFDQADQVIDIVSGGIGAAALADVRVYRDVAGKKRCVAVRTRA
jgi:release factor glutamine methyltransferase